MTTPAISKNVTATRQSVVITSTDVMPPTTSVLGNAIVEWDAEARPSSGNASMSNGYRLCRPWSHTGRKWAVTGGNAVATSKTGQHLHRVWPGQSFWVSSGNEMSPPLPGTPSVNLINSVEVKALNKLKSQDVHLGNFLAEGRKTIQMVTGGARLIANQVTRFRRSNPDKWELVKRYQRGNLPRSKWNCIPSAWLQLQYGWIPLMSDIFGAANHLSRRARFELPYVRVSASGQSSDKIQKTITGNQFSSTYKANFKANHKVTVTLIYGLEQPLLAELSSLGLINPVEIVWELVPYSFVVDWFLPIGSWLSALTADVGYSFITGTKGTKTEMSFDGVSDLVYNPVGYEVSISPSSYGGYTRNYGRTCYGSSPVPGLYVKNPLSGMHIANALALLVQAFR